MSHTGKSPESINTTKAEDDPDYKAATALLTAFMDVCHDSHIIIPVFAAVRTKVGQHSIMDGQMIACANSGCKACQDVILKVRALVCVTQPWETKQ